MATKLMEFFKKTPTAGSAKPALPKPVVLKASEILATLNAVRPRVMKGIPEKQALAVVSAALSALGTRIDEAGSTPVRIPGLGVFRSREVERKVEGELKRVRSIGFRRVPAAARKGSGA
jgi:hypothetical protein